MVSPPNIFLLFLQPLPLAVRELVFYASSRNRSASGVHATAPSRLWLGSLALLLACSYMPGVARSTQPTPESRRGSAASPDKPAGTASNIPSNPYADARAATADEREQTDGSDQDDNTVDEIAPQHAAHSLYRIDMRSGDGLRKAPPKLPDLSPYTPANAIAKIRRTPRGRASVGSMLALPPFKGFMGRNEHLREWVSRQGALPQVIFVRDGYATPRDLARQLPKTYFEETSPGVFIARLPIDVAPGATLHIDDSVKDFRLSLDHGAFLVNEGNLFITGSRLRGWNEKQDAPSTFVDKHDFRPFIISWGGSQTYIVKSVVANLGYAASKTYGISISQFSPGLAPIMKRSAPSGWLIGSEFYDNWYGFYCYEAVDVVVRGNDYHDNIKYGIDPHDRSRRLIIAGNKVYNTKIKHGIIVSREVDDSWIIDNDSFDNALSGIVIDRNSIHDVIAYNRVYRNHADGITIYESPDTRIWRNLAAANRRHGIRVRNSTDIRLDDNVAIGNNLSGIYGHIKNVSAGRNLQLDPFNARTSMTVVGGQLISNGTGPVTINQPFDLELYDVDMRMPQRQFGIKFTGILGTYQEQVLDILIHQKKAVILRPFDMPISRAN